MTNSLLPEQTWIGVLGGGQLGRMLAIEARRMGYHVAQWVGGPDSGSAGVADLAIETSFECEKTLETFVDLVDVVTVEFENLPVGLLRKIEARVPLRPNSMSVEIAQHREREKLFLQKQSIPCVPFAVVTDAQELALANDRLPGDKRVLKTAEFGYDGKGQVTLAKADSADAVWADFSSERAVLEQRIDLAGELSVLVARCPSGKYVVYDPAENIHTNHILDFSIVPARFEASTLTKARAIAAELCEALDYVGIMAVEFFLSRDGELLVNEMAPRPHNSGHHTIDACSTSQFEQQLRAVCNLPLGNTQLKNPVVMWNILGDIWPHGGQPDWDSILGHPNAKLHLYGKREPRVGRKMGHVSFTGDLDVESLLDHAKNIATKLHDI